MKNFGNPGEILISSRYDLQPLADYLEREVKPHVLKWDHERHFPDHVFAALHEMGIVGSSLPKGLGGSGNSMVDLLSIASQIASISPGVFSSWIGSMLAQTAVSLFAEPSLAEEVCKTHLTERKLMSFCATEYETGTDVISMMTTATETHDGFVIDGSKHFITNMNYSTHYVVFAKIKSAAGVSEKGISAFYVPRGLTGIELGAPLVKLGQNESNTGRCDFRGVRIPRRYLLGNPGDGYSILSSCISRTKTLISGASVGICQRSESEALDYLARRVRFGKALIEKKEIQAQLAEIASRVDAAWLLGCKAGSVWDAKKVAVRESSVAKLFAADLAVEVVNEAMELTGGSGYMDESILCKLHRDVKLFEIYEGASLVQKALIARELYGKVVEGSRSANTLKRVA